MARRTVIAALLAVTAAARADVPGVAARVNGVEIPVARLERWFEEYLAEKGRNVAAIRSPAAYRALHREALDRLVEAELLWQEARRLGLVATDAEVEAAVAAVRAGLSRPGAFERRLERGGFTAETYAAHVRQQLSIRKLVQREVAGSVKVTPEEVRALYEERAPGLTRPEEVRVRHLLVKASPGAPEAERAAARGRAEALLGRLRAGEPFAALARQHSEDATAAAGGDLGFVRRGQTVPPFEAAAFALAPGGLSELVETQFGFHVLTVEARRGGEPIPEREAREGLEAELRAGKARRALEDRVRALREGGRVEIAAAYGGG